MLFYRISWEWDEKQETDEWFLSNSWERFGHAIDVWSYVTCRPGQRDPTPFLKIRHPGARTSFVLAGPEQVPVVAPPIADLLEHLAGDDFERIPAIVEDGTPMEIINVLSCVDCIDYDKSIFDCFGPKNKVRPDRAGELHVDLRLVIDPARVGNHLIFRLRDLKAPLIVAESIKETLDDANVSGIVFQPILTHCDEPGRFQYWDDDLRLTIVWPREEREAFLKSRNGTST